MDKTQENYQSVIHRSRKEKFWGGNMHHCLRNDFTGDFKRHNTHFRLLTKPEIDHRSRHKRLARYPIAL